MLVDRRSGNHPEEISRRKRAKLKVNKLRKRVRIFPKKISARVDE